MGKAFDEVGLEQAIFVLKKDKMPQNHAVIIKNYKTFINQIPQQFFIDKSIILTSLDKEKFNLVQKIEKKSILLSTIADMPRGISCTSNLYSDKKNRDNTWVLGGTNIKRYTVEDGGKRKPNRYFNFKENNNILNEKKDIFKSKRIIYQNIAPSVPKIVATIVEDYITDDTINNLILLDKNYSDEYILALLNSKLFTFYLKYAIINNATLTVHLDKPYVGRFPIRSINLKDQNYFITQINKIFELYSNFKENQISFLSLIESNFDIKINQKLEKWFEMNVIDFIKELKKTKKGLSLPSQKEWQKMFNTEQPTIKNIVEELKNIENELNKKIYELYNLTTDEINLIENE
jgi:hypothetical protein